MAALTTLIKTNPPGTSGAGGGAGGGAGAGDTQTLIPIGRGANELIRKRRPTAQVLECSGKLWSVLGSSGGFLRVLGSFGGFWEF